ncbi:hypothetical protein Mal64_10160 [Pseudobythopirellula maris]|uniref:Uncharacterized protein n=1 Tax=Pseudobythopirellula maris TaxID=2527991 RepID=A0A5C5ZSV4_9BACT|nr:hypothetical protein [Pseudobythopirellula maris]TWT90622.1 hypothetical protein Mal64_10160 [Pseudobythopirellula maris]
MSTPKKPLPNESFGEASTSPADRAELLMNLCLDGGLSDAEAAELDTLLAESPEARKVWIGLAALHTDLSRHFSKPSTMPPTGSREGTAEPLTGLFLPNDFGASGSHAGI